MHQFLKGLVGKMNLSLKRIFAVMLSAAMLVFCMVFVCAAPVSAAQKVGLSKTSITLEVGETASLKLNGASGGKITWSMSDKNIAKYSKGKVTGVSEGTAYIYAKYNGKKYKCTVTVTSSSDESTVNVKKGGSVTVYVYTDIDSIMIECSDQKICSFSGSALSDGSGYKLKIKGKKNGTATILIYDAYSSGSAVEFYVNVGSVSDGTVYFELPEAGDIIGGETYSFSWGGDNDTSDSTDTSGYVDEVIKLINKERKAAGLPALKKNDALCDDAKVRVDEINSTFSHTRPDGTLCFTAITVPYGYAGENIAKGQTTPEDVMDCWMNSDGHRKNILSKDYTSVGVGYDPSTNCWVQIFISD